MPAPWQYSSFPHLPPPCSFAYDRQPHRVTLPSSVPTAPMLDPMALSPPHLTFIPTHSLPIVSGSRPSPTFPCTFSVAITGRANLLSSSSPPLPVLRAFIASFRYVADPPPRSPGYLPQAHESCITVHSEMNSLTSLHRARMPKIIRPPYKNFFFAFFLPLASFLYCITWIRP